MEKQGFSSGSVRFCFAENASKSDKKLDEFYSKIVTAQETSSPYSPDSIRYQAHSIRMDVEPESHAEATDSEEWVKVMEEEMQSKISNKTWTLLHRPMETKILHNLPWNTRSIFKKTTASSAGDPGDWHQTRTEYSIDQEWRTWWSRT
jgi:hypothetical protein